VRVLMLKKVILFISVPIAAVFALDQERLDSLAEYASSTVIGKDDSPVSISGDFYTRARNVSFVKMPSYLLQDRERTYIDAGLSLNLDANPNSNVNFFATVFFPMDFTGYYANSAACTPNALPNNDACKMVYHHDMNISSISLTENVLAGVDVRGGEFGAVFKAGGVLWTNTSPLTIWERQFTPQYVSVYETYEWERNVSTYYKEKSFKPVTEGGRAFWSNRSFGGLLLDVYKMPFGLQAQALLAQTIDDDQGSRDGLRSMNNRLGEAEGLGTLDFRSDVYAFRLAKKDVGPVMIGLNFLATNQDRGIIYEKPGIFDRMGDTEPTKANNDNPNLINYMVSSVDFKGNITQKFYMLLDIGLSIDDSTVFKKKPDDINYITDEDYVQDYYRTKKSDPSIAIYLKAQSKYGIPITTEIAYIAPDFYSPYGMTDYSRHRSWRKDQIPLGAGAYRYTPNLAGANIKVEPEFNRGRFNVTYSQHRQVEKGNDAISFPYRLNGRNLWEATPHWSKYNPAVSLFPSPEFDGYTQYRSRIGGITAFRKDDPSGGQRGGVWEIWEYFGNYESLEDVKERNITQTAKWSSVLNIDMGYDIGHWFGTDRNIMLSAVTALSSISSDITPLPYGESAKGTMLWGWFLQAEPSVAITENLHGLLIAGLELFRAPNVYGEEFLEDQTGVTQVSGIRKETVHMPIKYRETALGAGFDWDFAPRAGLHVRYKYATHRDETNPANDWKAHMVNAETKVWF